MKKLELAVACLSVFGFALANATSAQAEGTVILEGSDAIGLHCTQEGASEPGACVYENQVWKALEGPSSLPIAAIGNVPGVGTAFNTSGVVVDNFASVAAAAAFGSGGLGQFAALYFISGSGCCIENDSLITAGGASGLVTGYLGGGGTVMIENYTGGAAWDAVVGTTGGANGAVIGVGGGAGAGSTCDDGERVTALGLANGFTQPPAIGCWEHQGYNEAVFAPLGYTESFYDAAGGMGGAGWSGLLSSGSTLTGAAAPEPASFLLIGVGLTGLGLLRRRMTR